MTAAGRIILINGASSAGKTTLARAVQAKIDGPFLHYSIDHLRDSGVLPSGRLKTREFRWAQMREAFFDGFERSVVGFAAGGNDLIVDHIMESRAWAVRFARRLAGLDVFFVGLRCPVEELERRERARGDRPLGDARRDHQTVHGYCLYDAEFDGTVQADANAERLIALWLARLRPSAIEKMAMWDLDNVARGETRGA